jgi:hypothetical protein
MAKLTLKLEELGVETFDLGADGTERGTVHAHGTFACTARCDTDGPTCNGGPTCGTVTCNADPTCNYHSCGTCDSYCCATGEASCENFSCVYTCTVQCSQGPTYSCTPDQC